MAVLKIRPERQRHFPAVLAQPRRLHGFVQEIDIRAPPAGDGVQPAVKVPVLALVEDFFRQLGGKHLLQPGAQILCTGNAVVPYPKIGILSLPHRIRLIHGHGGQIKPVVEPRRPIIGRQNVLLEAHQLLWRGVYCQPDTAGEQYGQKNAEKRRVQSFFHRLYFLSARRWSQAK